MKIGVIGGGSWATAIVKMLNDNGHFVNWWIFEQDVVDHLRKYSHNPQYLSSVQFKAELLNINSNLAKVVSHSDLIILVVPSVYLKTIMTSISVSSYVNKTVFNAVKGIIPEDNSIIIDFIKDDLAIPFENIGMISGPCHAEEVALERLSYLTVACKDNVKAEHVANLLQNRYIKTTTSDDVYGVAIASVIKNVFAIASGICHGLGYGDNFQSVLISNAIQELERFVDGVHPIKRDICKSAYLGDLLVTAYSQFSRNRFFGNMIGKGYTIKSAKAEMKMVAEGYYAVKCINEINKKYDIDMPIIEAVYNICYDSISPIIEIKILSDKLS